MYTGTINVKQVLGFVDQAPIIDKVGIDGVAKVKHKPP